MVVEDIDDDFDWLVENVFFTASASDGSGGGDPATALLASALSRDAFRWGVAVALSRQLRLSG